MKSGSNDLTTTNSLLTMNKFHLLLCLFLLFSCSKESDPLINNPNEEEITETTLFNKDRAATAYYVEPDVEQVIYLWDGRPTSYIVTDDAVIYGFNGQFLGWFENGVIYGLDGKRVGFEKGALNLATLAEPVKHVKHVRPVRVVKEAKPAKPAFSNDWSTIPLDSFFLAGIE